MWVQYFQRKIEYLTNNGAHREANAECGDFLLYLEKEGTKFFDDTIIDHILKITPSLRTLLAENRIDTSQDSALNKWVETEIISGSVFEFEDGRFFGTLKERGRQENFGFLESRDGREFFLAKANVTSDVWAWLLQDGPVEFSVRTKSGGRIEGFNVTKFDRDV